MDGTGHRRAARRRHWRLALVLGAAAVLGGCSPEVGSDAWCKEMDAKPKGDWTANEASSYTKHCVLGLKPDRQ